jgi:hypothetical protein
MTTELSWTHMVRWISEAIRLTFKGREREREREREKVWLWITKRHSAHC